MAVTVASSTGLEPWIAFLRAHSAITRQLNADLLTDHGLTLNDYEVLLVLSRAEGRTPRTAASGPSTARMTSASVISSGGRPSP